MTLMRALALLNLLISCLAACCLLGMAAALLALTPIMPALVWPAAGMLWAALWMRR